MICGWTWNEYTPSIYQKWVLMFLHHISIKKLNFVSVTQRLSLLQKETYVNE